MPPRKKWDTVGLALLGAGLGAVVQGSHEILQNVIARSAVRDTITFCLGKMTQATLAGAVLFVAIALAYNNIVMPLRKDGPAVEPGWSLNDLLFAGAGLAILLGLVHEVFDFASGRWRAEFLASADPFSHIVWELSIAGLGGELVFRTIARLRKWTS